MDIRQLEAFIAVVEAGSFSRAGKLLHLTQPTISAHISAMEQETNVKLVVRTSAKVYPSKAGRLLYDYAKQIVSLRDEALDTVMKLSQVMEGTIVVAASSIPGHYYLPSLMQSFRARYPDISFELQITDSADVVHKVSRRRADLGFSGTMIENRNCVYQKFAIDHLVLIAPNKERFRRYQALGTFPVEQILHEPFINRELGSGTRRETETFFRVLGLNPEALNTVVAVPSTESILNMVSEGMGLAVVSQSACRDHCAFQKLLSFDLGGEMGDRSLYLVRHKRNILSPIAQVFYEFAKGYEDGADI